MPGSDIVQRQSVLGGIAGVALLAFALAYRFYPTLQSGRAPAGTGDATHATSPALIARATHAVANTPQNPETVAAVEEMGPPASLAPPAPPPPKAIAALLKKADSAFEHGHLFEANDGALAIYRKVLDADSRSAAAKAGVEKIRDTVIKQTEDALDRGDEDESARLIAALQDTALDEGHLAALQGRLKKLRQTTPLLTRAADLLQQIAAESDPGAVDKTAETALGIYRQVTKIDAGNKLADQGMAQLERIYLDRALAAAAQDDFGGADQILAGASSIRPGSHELLDTRTQIEGIRHQRATAVMTQANSALDAGNPDLAQLLEQKALGLSPDVGGIDAFNERLRNARLYASFKPGQVISDAFLDRNGRAPALVVIPTGSFLMGSPAGEAGHRATEEPQREVKIGIGFALGRDEVSVAAFRVFVEDSDYISDSEKLNGSIVYDEDSGRTISRSGISWRNDYTGGIANDNQPVIHVSWNDASAYVHWLSVRTGKHYRLPSEAEFEYALRSGSTTRFWWGDGNPTKVVANLTGDGDKSPAQRRWTNAFPHYSDGYWGPSPVGKFPPDPFGVRDIDGNVSEWVEDCWHDSYLRAPADSRAWVNPGCARHVVRGASWGSAPDQSRSAFRTNMPTDARSAQIGFRVARDL